MMRRISSDTMAKINTFAVALILLVVGSAAALGGFFLLNSDGSKTYEITIDVSDMEVAEDSGHVYNVCKKTVGGDKYYDPRFNTFSLNSESGEAILYLSATLNNVEKFSERKIVGVQSVKTPVAGTVDHNNTIVFKVTSSADSVIVTLFLMLRGEVPNGYSEASVLSNGTVVDIYGDSAGQSGINISVDLKDGSEQLDLIGNENSDMRGLLKATVTTKVI